MPIYFDEAAPLRIGLAPRIRPGAAKAAKAGGGGAEEQLEDAGVQWRGLLLYFLNLLNLYQLRGVGECRFDTRRFKTETKHEKNEVPVRHAGKQRAERPIFWSAILVVFSKY